MRIVGRLLSVLWAGVFLSTVAAVIAALQAKRDFVSIDDPEANEIRIAAIFRPLSFRSTAQSFRGGTIECRFGGGVVDLREAVLDPAGARLEVKAHFGGAQFLVPDTWRVTSRVVGIGGAGDRRPRIERAEDEPQLTIVGTALFGGFGIASEIAEDAANDLEEAVAKVAAMYGPVESADRELAAAH
jgi:hypothetical protein